MSGPSQDVEVRLAEIDRRLREIQADLVPGRTPRETQMPAARRPPEATAPPRPPAPQSPRPAPRARSSAPHGRSGPLADALASARRRRAQDAEEPRPAPSRPRAEPEPSSGVGPLASSLLAAIRDLLEGYEWAVSGPAQSHPVGVSVSAGPFSSTEALREFERALARIPEVREVNVSGYDATDRAILEVQIEHGAPTEPST